MQEQEAQMTPEAEIAGSEEQIHMAGDIPQGEIVQHEITQEDLDMNPILAEEGLKAGEVIELNVVSKEVFDATTDPSEPTVSFASPEAAE